MMASRIFSRRLMVTQPTTTYNLSSNCFHSLSGSSTKRGASGNLKENAAAAFSWPPIFTKSYLGKKATNHQSSELGIKLLSGNYKIGAVREEAFQFHQTKLPIPILSNMSNYPLPSLSTSPNKVGASRQYSLLQHIAAYSSSWSSASPNGDDDESKKVERNRCIKKASQDSKANEVKDRIVAGLVITALIAYIMLLLVQFYEAINDRDIVMFLLWLLISISTILQVIKPSTKRKR